MMCTEINLITQGTGLETQLLR